MPSLHAGGRFPNRLTNGVFGCRGRLVVIANGCVQRYALDIAEAQPTIKHFLRFFVHLKPPTNSAIRWCHRRRCLLAARTLTIELK
jgi:hypothetical protein